VIGCDSLIQNEEDISLWSVACMFTVCH